jgi:hypothetical protein
LRNSERHATQQNLKKAQKEEIKQKPKPFIYGSPERRSETTEAQFKKHARIKIIY